MRNFDTPDEIIKFGGATEELISIGGLTVSRSTQPVGWRWSEHFKPLVGGEWCQAHHMGIVLSGRWGAELDDGTVFELGPGDLYDIAGWVGGSPRHRRLATLLFTDVIDSTRTAASLGDAAWHDLLSMHFHACRDAIERFGGHHVTTTGDGILAIFGAAAPAVRCAAAIREIANRQGIAIRAGGHVGQVEIAGDDFRGVTVHEAARIMAEVGADEIVVSEATAMLCRTSDLTFEVAGEHELTGVPDRWRLYRAVG